MLRRPALLLAVAAALAACKPSPAPVGGAPNPGAQPAGAPALDVVELSATDAARRMAAGELSSHALTQAYLERIARIDDAGPTLNAVI